MSKEVNVLHYCGDCLNKVVDVSEASKNNGADVLLLLVLFKLILYGIIQMLLIALEMGDIVVNLVSDMAAFYG